MSRRGWTIPQDWNGQTWQCYRLLWPASEQYARLLVGLLYTLTRGREYDKSTGTITDAQEAGWQIFDNNYPLVLCGADSESGDVPTLAWSGGGLVVIDSEGDMGQVVTEVYVDEATGELVVEYGKCCVYRFPMIASTGTEYGPDGEPITTPTEPVPPTGMDPPVDPLGYDACAKITTLMDRILAIGDAAWDNKTSPWDVAGGIRDVNPGYSFSMTNVTSLYISIVGLVAIEAVTDADIFNQEFLDAWKCYGLKFLDDDADGFTKEQWLQFTLYPTYYVFSDGTPDLDAVFDVWAAGFWADVCNVLGRERAMQVMQESVGTTEDCSGCENPGAGDEWSDYDWVVEYNFLVDDQNWTINQDQWVDGVGFQGTNNWWGGSALDDVQSPKNSAAVAGSIRRFEMDWSGVQGTDNEHWEGDLTLVRTDDDNLLMLDREQLQALGFGTVQISGVWPYDEDTMNQTWLHLTYQKGGTGGTRYIVTRVKIGGMGDQPWAGPVV
jgi:hypothetical protein